MRTIKIDNSVVKLIGIILIFLALCITRFDLEDLARYCRKVNVVENVGAKITDLTRQLSAERTKTERLERKLDSLCSQLQSALEELAERHAEISELSTELDEVERMIAKLKTWISINAYLPETIIKQIHARCGNPVAKKEDTCFIDTYKMGSDTLGCLGFEWDDSRGREDFDDFDTQKFWNARKGDCRDFSLFTAAWLRYEIEDAKGCSKTGVLMGNIIRKTIYVSDGSRVYTVCGCFSDESCHCEVGVNNARSPYESDFFQSIFLFDPQGGFYKGASMEEFDGGIVRLFSDANYYAIDPDSNEVLGSLT
jgi:uncharacterized protein YoxC